MLDLILTIKSSRVGATFNRARPCVRHREPGYGRGIDSADRRRDPGARDPLGGDAGQPEPLDEGGRQGQERRPGIDQGIGDRDYAGLIWRLEATLDGPEILNVLDRGLRHDSSHRVRLHRSILGRGPLESRSSGYQEANDDATIGLTGSATSRSEAASPLPCGPSRRRRPKSRQYLGMSHSRRPINEKSLSKSCEPTGQPARGSCEG